MDDIKFKSINDLYRRLSPALTTKKDEINLLFKSRIDEIDIWNYLRNNVWNEAKALTLADMVDDILSISCNEVYQYVKSKY